MHRHRMCSQSEMVVSEGLQLQLHSIFLLRPGLTPMVARKNHHHRYGIRGSWINRAAVASEQAVAHRMGFVDRTLSRVDDI